MPFGLVLNGLARRSRPLFMLLKAAAVLHPFALLVVAGFAAGLMPWAAGWRGRPAPAGSPPQPCVMTLAVRCLFFLMAALAAPTSSVGQI